MSKETGVADATQKLKTKVAAVISSADEADGAPGEGAIASASLGKAAGALSDKTASALSEKDVLAMSKALLKKDAKITDLEQRLGRLEKRLKTNERFARTFATCMDTQVIAIDAVTGVIRRALKTDAAIASDLSAAIHEYDRHKVRRWLSGFCGVFLWVGSVAAAAFVGAFIYWAFAPN